MIRPAWKEHITVVRNEEPPNKQLWGVYNSVSIVYSYKTDVMTDGLFYWLDVEFSSNLVRSMRNLLGLSFEPLIPYHITIGSTEEAEALMRLRTSIKEECPICGAGNVENFIICRECGGIRSQMKEGTR